MFGNLHWLEITLLLLLALFIFGDKLPQVIADGMRMLRNLHRMARSATTDLSRELGTDIQIEDLHPKTFIRKHLLSEADERALVNPLKTVSDDLVKQGRALSDDVKDVGKRTRGVTDEVKQATDLRRPAKPAASGRSAPAVSEGSAAPATPPEPAQPAALSRPSYDDIT